MDPGITSELLRYGPGGLIAALAILALIAVWKLWQAAELALKLAAVALSDQKLLNVRSEAVIELLKYRVEELQRDLDKCEQRLAQPGREPSP